MGTWTRTQIIIPDFMGASLTWSLLLRWRALCYAPPFLDVVPFLRWRALCSAPPCPPSLTWSLLLRWRALSAPDGFMGCFVLCMRTLFYRVVVHSTVSQGLFLSECR